MLKNILVIEDKPSQLRLAESSLRYNLNYHSISTNEGISDVTKFLSSLLQPDAVLIDLTISDQSYLKVIRDIKMSKPEWPIIAITQYGNDELAIQAIRAGASDYITKPATLERLNLTIQNVLKIQNMSEAIARLERSENEHVSLTDIVGSGEAIKKAIEQAEKLSSSDMPIWIDGEHGTGKELFARAIHGNCSISGEPFVMIDCSKLAEVTVETIMFGKKRAIDTLQFFVRKIHDANNGTLYLKNIGALPPRLQQCLFESLETGLLPVVDEFLSMPITFRIIIGSSKAEEILASKDFSPMQGRLQGVVISLPPLRERKEDIAALAKHFVAMHAASENRVVPNLSDDAVRLLENNPWPGNIIQLSRTIQRAVLMCNHDEIDSGTMRLIQQLESINYSNKSNEAMIIAPTLVDVSGHIKKLKSIEEEVIRFALVHSGGSMTRAARNLGIGRSTLYRKIGSMEPKLYISRENQTMRPMMDISATNRS